MSLLSICVPTYKRSKYLKYLLDSIEKNKITKLNRKLFDVCISENRSISCSLSLIRKYKEKINIKYKFQNTFLKRGDNMHSAISLSKNKYTWLLGDDDILLPHSIETILNILKFNKKISFFYLNCYTNNKPFSNYKKLFFLDSIRKKNKNFFTYEKSFLQYLDLADKEISPDLTGGMFQCVFDRKKWLSKSCNFYKKEKEISKEFLTLESTFPHSVVLIESFYKEKIYLVRESLVVENAEAREWKGLYPFVRSFRTLELLEKFKEKNLNLKKYLRMKNFLLRFAIPDIVYIIVKYPGYLRSINLRLTFSYFLYPNFYLSFFTYLYKKILRKKI